MHIQRTTSLLKKARNSNKLIDLMCTFFSPECNTDEREREEREIGERERESATFFMSFIHFLDLFDQSEMVSRIRAHTFFCVMKPNEYNIDNIDLAFTLLCTI